MTELEANLEKNRSEAQGSHDRSWPAANVSSELWGTMLNLIYTGHGRRAWQFLEEAWPQNIHGKQVFRKEFSEHLKKSPYWVNQLKSWIESIC